MLFEFNELIPKIRLNALKTNKPYDLDDLKGLGVDNDGLVDIHQYMKSNRKYRYMLCLPINNANSNHWIWEKIYDLKDNGEISFRIRLDPFAKNPLIFINKMTIFGESLNWEKLSSIKDVSQTHFLENGRKTYLFWKKSHDKLYFYCEELPKYEEICYRGSRYFHAIYDIEKQCIIHCDGSIKIYDEDNFFNRMDIFLWDENYKKYGGYVKIF